MATTMSRETLQTNLSTQSLDCQREALENSGDNIRVYVRVRPPTEREQIVTAQPIVAIDRRTNSVLLRGEQPRTFTFDGVLGDDSSQDEVFELVGRRISSSCLSGYNGSVYVYGQTGVGKTYTLFGPVSSVQSMHFDERRGLICRILDHVFAEIHRRRACAEGVTYLCRCSFLEIYKEQITDLLEPGNSNLQVREDMNRGVYVERLSEPTVWSLTEAFQVLWKGLQQRHIGATTANERSSRSHAVFTLSVEVAQTRAGVTSTRIAHLSLVDLAGSERQNGTLDASGVAVPYQSLRVKEAGAINRSLSALTNVIMSLSRAATSRRRSNGGDARRPYVHYRDSKLTFLLRDSLGGNSKTVIVANMSPSALCFAETLSTLKFAARAKHIRCAAVRNEEYSGTVESLMEEVKGLRQQLAQLSSRGFNASRSHLQLDAASLARDDSRTGFDEDHGGHEEDENQVLYSRKRVRRLEVLLAAGLERERHADHRRHHLHRLAEFLEDLDFRKEQFMRNLHKDYTALVGHIEEGTQYDGTEETADLTAKFLGFSQLLANLIPGKAGTSWPEASKDPAVLSSGEGTESADAARQAGVPPQARPRKRGTSQSLQRGGLSAAPVGGHGMSLGIHTSSFPGGLVDETTFLREENRRLQQQLERHPEVPRLAAENRTLRAQLAKLECLSTGGRTVSRSSQPASRSSRGARPAKQDTRLTKTLRSAVLGVVGGSLKDPTSSAQANSSDDDAVESTSEVAAEQECGLPVTSEMMQRIADVDEDSTLRAWVHFQKMAKEVEELIRAKENLSALMKQMHNNEGNWDAALRSKGEPGLAKSSSLRNVVEPQVVEELVQGTHDALALAQNIIDSRGGGASPSAGAKQEDEGSAASGSVLQRHQRLSSSVPALHRGASGILKQDRSSRVLGTINDYDVDSPRSSFPLSGLHNTPAAVAASAMRGVSPRTEPFEKIEIKQAIQKVKHLHGTLDLVNNTYNDAYDQFQRLREEYESRLEECQFFELQCSRLDMHCHELAERLHGSAAVRGGTGSYSATGFSPASASSQQRRCFSLSSLRDENFWQQRFQELSQLTGIDEAERGQERVQERGQQPETGVYTGLASSGSAAGLASSGSAAVLATSGSASELKDLRKKVEPPVIQALAARTRAASPIPPGGLPTQNLSSALSKSQLHRSMERLPVTRQLSTSLSGADLLQHGEISARTRSTQPSPPLSTSGSTERLPVTRQLSASFSGTDLLQHGDLSGRNRSAQPPPLSSSGRLDLGSISAAAQTTPSSSSLSGSISSRVLGRSGPASMIASASPRVASLSARPSSTTSFGTATVSNAATPALVSSTSPAGSAPAAATASATLSARPVVRSSPPAAQQRTASHGLRTAPRALLGATAPHGSTLAYPATGTAFSPHS